KLATVLNASGFDTVYGEGKNLVATLKDINGNAVENVNVSIKLDNVTYVKTTDASGQVSLFVDLLPKYYHAAVVFAGDNRYGASYDNVNVTVNKLGTVLNATGFTAYYGNPKNLTVTLKDINGNAVGNVNVSIKLVNATYVRTTDSNGQVSVLLDLLPKQYKAMISFDGDNRYAYSRTSANVIVNKVPAVMDASTVTTVYSDGEYIVASLKDVNGNSIQDTEVHIQVNNETYVRTTDNNGEVKVLVDLLPKQYNAVITIADDDRYTDSYITVPIVVKKLGTSVNATGFTTVYGKSKYVYATLVDEHGNALKNTNISVKFVSKTYVASTDENGQMKLLLNIVPKIYKAVVTFEGDDKYIKSTTTVNITVYKATPNLTAPKKSFKKSVKTKKYTVTLKTNLNKVMKNTKVTLKVNKKTYSAKTNSKGKATFKITNLKKKGTFKATVKYSGSKYYKAKSVTTKITVK
ncbi:MAG: hypothetical protein IJ287_08150, partial [Methanobrevibacter sp.]|nr:hypothetical protein [Methanobrevibacter sp.]